MTQVMLRAAPALPLAVVVALADLFFGMERVALWEDAARAQQLRVVAFNR